MKSKLRTELKRYFIDDALDIIYTIFLFTGIFKMLQLWPLLDENLVGFASMGVAMIFLMTSWTTTKKYKTPFYLLVELFLRLIDSMKVKE